MEKHQYQLMLLLSYPHGGNNQLKAKLIAFERKESALTHLNELSRRLMVIEVVSETTVTMLYPTLGDGKQFKNERQASALDGRSRIYLKTQHLPLKGIN